MVDLRPIGNRRHTHHLPCGGIFLTTAFNADAYTWTGFHPSHASCDPPLCPIPRLAARGKNVARALLRSSLPSGRHPEKVTDTVLVCPRSEKCFWHRAVPRNPRKNLPPGRYDSTRPGKCHRRVGVTPVTHSRGVRKDIEEGIVSNQLSPRKRGLGGVSGGSSFVSGRLSGLCGLGF
jgi:hypothetical protein